jgi:beta-glucosidase
MENTTIPARLSAERVETLLSQMTLAEKIGQMTQVEKNSISPEETRERCIGSVISGGGGAPAQNTPAAWLAMVEAYRQAALETRLGIPLIYGADAVHGHNNVYGATVFPHNIGLGAVGDAGLVERIAGATAEEVAATGIRWDFAPTLAVPQDIRWGRTYEGFSERTELVTRLGRAAVRGLQSAPWRVAATAKHFIGDGGTQFGSSETVIADQRYLLDQGETRMDEATLRALFLPPYLAAIEEGVLAVMASFNSWNGVRMHAHRRLLADVLKGELGFAGLVVSDWQAIDQISSDYQRAVVSAINAGVDMTMVPYDYRRFIAEATLAVEQGEIPIERIDDAVRRILGVKFALGLFDPDISERPPLARVGAVDHRTLAREAVRKSLVLLKNANGSLPIPKDVPVIFLGGEAADDIGLQCGGWTVQWLGGHGRITPGTTLLEATRRAVSPSTRVEFDPAGEQAGRAGVGIAVVAEEPYAEGMGDRADLTLPERDRALVARMRAKCDRLILLVLSGRPLILTEQAEQVDGVVAAWLPGTEGDGLADVLFGDAPFSGKLPYAWPRSMDQIPLRAHPGAVPLFPFGFGLETRS